MVSGFGMGGGKEVGTGVRSAARDFRLAQELTDRQLARGGGNLTRNHANDTVNPTAAAGGARGFPDGSFQQRAREAAGENGVLESRERAAGLGRLLADIRNTRTIRDARRRQAEAASIRNRAEARGLEAENLREMGVTGVADEAAAPILADDVLGRDWVRTVEEYARKGVALRAMLGSIERQGRSGGSERVRAWVSGDGKNIIVQADHPTLSWQQLLAHEELHRRIKENSAFKKAAQDTLLADKSLKPYLSQIIDRYTEAYRAVKPSITDDEVIEELLADYRAGFDMLDPLGTLAGVRKATKAAARDIRALERKGTKGEAAAESEENGDSIRYSINMDFSGVTPATLEESVMMDATDKRNLARYIGEVDRALNRTLPFTQKILIGRPSPILSQYMKSDNPLYMTQRAAKKSLLGKERRRENTGLVKQCFMNFRSTWRTRLLLQEIRPSILNVGKTVLLFGQIGYQKTEMA